MEGQRTPSLAISWKMSWTGQNVSKSARNQGGEGEIVVVRVKKRNKKNEEEEKLTVRGEKRRDVPQ